MRVYIYMYNMYIVFASKNVHFLHVRPNLDNDFIPVLVLAAASRRQEACLGADSDDHSHSG